MRTEVTAGAPATIGNVGMGFDVLGLALGGRQDYVTARRADHGEIRITGINGDGGVLSTEIEKNTAGIAARHTRILAGQENVGIDLSIDKGIPLESGLGSSAASAAAAACAVNLLLGSPLRKSDLIAPCVEAEAAISGRHADNVAPALLGGLVMVRCVDPRPKIQRLPVPRDLSVVVVTPQLRLPTQSARDILPEQIPLAARTRNTANMATFVSACYANDLGRLGDCVDDEIVNATRLPLIKGAEQAMAAARAAGSLGHSISGAGPSLFAFVHAPDIGKAVGEAMVGEFNSAGVAATFFLSPGDCPGARVLQQTESNV